jgi:hypothetical protein
MLVVEYNSNGRNIVKLIKDWHPSRISRAYTPPMKNYVIGRNAERLQSALLKGK